MFSLLLAPIGSLTCTLSEARLFRIDVRADVHADVRADVRADARRRPHDCFH